MAQTIQTYSITAPGFYGLNTQDSSLDLQQGFALVATNCVIDQYGRVGARKGWEPQHTTIGALGSADVKAIGQLVTDGGIEYVLCAGNNKLFKLSGGVLTELTYGGGGVAPTITDSNWQLASLNEQMVFFQEGFDALLFDPLVSTTTYRRVSEKAGSAGTVPKANSVLSAYGRLWAANTDTQKSVVYFSDLLTTHVWTTGTSGTLDVTTVWPNGSDNITGLASHNGFLYIFGKNQILIYQNATNPSTMSLYDTITGIGCIARDSIQNTGTDIIFLSDTGVRSLLRTIQEKSAPLRDISKNVRNDLMGNVASETAKNIKAIYSPFDSFYLLTLPTLGAVYCFDTKATLEDGSARVTTWDSMRPTSFCYTRNKELLIGKAGYIGKYGNYTDNGASYRMMYFTNHADLGTPSVATVLKKLNVVVIGGSNQYLTMKWGYDFTSNYQAQSVQIKTNDVAYFGESEYNIAEYSPGTALQTLTAYPTGSGKVIQTGYEADILGTPLSIQKLEIFAKNGKIA